MDFALFIHSAQYAASRYCALECALPRYGPITFNSYLTPIIPTPIILSWLVGRDTVSGIHGFCSLFPFGAIRTVPLLRLTALLVVAFTTRPGFISFLT